tara:strand:+ start:111 stop:1091 length:981 start_codon:yes stop_codon:yes gene_type:complete
MNILYGIQGTGNGHLSRGEYIYNLLKKYSNNIDVLISGDNYSLKPSIPITYKNKGITFSISNGKIDYLKSLSNLDLITSFLEQRDIPFKKYDLIITDFEPVTAWSSIRYKIPSIHISHQASFLEENVPRPAFRSIIGEYIMKYFCPTNDYIGLHYQKYGNNISEPIISKRIQNCSTQLQDHVTVYLSWYNDDFLLNFFKQIPNLVFHIFSKNINKSKKQNNCFFYPTEQISFLESMRTSSGVICNAGFQTSSEVIYLGKRLLVIPVEGQYEQLCNVAALKKIGIYSLNKLNTESLSVIKSWWKSKPIKIKFKNNLEDFLDKKISKK